MDPAGPPSSVSVARSAAFDVLKGIGIVEVVTHHSFSFSARKFTDEFSPEWWALILSNRLFHFAIPTFLLASALLLARSLSKSPKLDLNRYAKRRVLRTLVPYLVWSFAYLFVRAIFVRVGSDVQPYTLTLPLIGSITGPNVFLDPAELKYYLLWGKAYYHLYFLSVLLQLTIALPFFVWLLRRRKIGFGWVLGASAALQFGAFLMQANVWRSPHPASTLAWYLPSLLIGAWLGMNWQDWPGIWARGKRWFFAAAMVGGAPFLVLSAFARQNVHLSNLGMNASLVVYATAVALCLLGWTQELRADRPVVRVLAHLGSLSLPIFVIHPAMLHLMGGPRISAVLDWLPASPLVVVGLTMVAALCISRLLIWMRLDMLLFGRRFRQEMRPIRAEAPAPVPVA